MTISGAEATLWVTALLLSRALVLADVPSALVAGLRRLWAEMVPEVQHRAVSAGGDVGAAYRVIVTRGYEYHLLEQVCVGVRDRKTGRWRPSHEALNCRVGGSVMQKADRPVLLPGAPRVGDALWFSAQGRRTIQTEPVLGVESPTRMSHGLQMQAASLAAEIQDTGSKRSAQPHLANEDEYTGATPIAKATTVLQRPARLHHRPARLHHRPARALTEAMA